MDIQSRIIEGLQKLIQGAQTDPQGTAMKAAMSPVDPMVIQQLLDGVMFPQQSGQSGFAQMLYGQPPKQMPQESFTPSPMLADLQQSKTAPQKSPWQIMKPGEEGLPQANDTAGWDQVMKTSGPAPGLTPEQIAKIASLMPRGTKQQGGGGIAPSGHAPRAVQMGQLSIPQRQAAPSLAAILRGGR